MRMFSSLLIFYILLSLNGCYFWASNREIEGTIVDEKYLRYEDVVIIKDDSNSNFMVRFQLAVEEKSGYDPAILRSLKLVGKRCKVITGPHGVVFKAFLFHGLELYEIPKK